MALGVSAGDGARGDVTAVSICSRRFPHRASCWARRVSRRLSRSSGARKNAPTASSTSAAADAPRTNGGSHRLRLGRGSAVNVGIVGDRPPGGCSSEPGLKRARDRDRTSVSQRLASLPGSSSSSLTRSTASPCLPARYPTMVSSFVFIGSTNPREGVRGRSPTCRPTARQGLSGRSRSRSGGAGSPAMIGPA